MAVNALYVLNSAKEVLLEKVWTGSVDFSAINYFIMQSNKYEDATQV